MKKKKCFRCGTRKSLTDFYTHKMMKDGHLNKCKECTCRDAKKAREKRIEYWRAYDRERSMLPHRVKARKQYSKTDAGKAAQRRAHQKQNRISPIKRGARIIVGNALRAGRITRPKYCEDCGEQKRLHGHHDDYEKPMDVRWLCAACHHEWHAKHGQGLNG